MYHFCLTILDIDLFIIFTYFGNFILFLTDVTTKYSILFYLWQSYVKKYLQRWSCVGNSLFCFNTGGTLLIKVLTQKITISKWHV